MKHQIKILIVALLISAIPFLIMYIPVSFYYLTFDFRSFSAISRSLIFGITFLCFAMMYIKILLDSK